MEKQFYLFSSGSVKWRHVPTSLGLSLIKWLYHLENDSEDFFLGSHVYRIMNMVECQQLSNNSDLGCNPIRCSPAFLKARLVGGFKFIATNLFICTFTCHLGKWHVLFRKENERISWALFYVFRLTPTVSCHNTWMLVEDHFPRWR